MGKKSKTESADADVSQKEEETVSYEDRLRFVSAISKPMASRKLTKKVYKLVKKAHKAKKPVMGIKSVQKAVRTGSKGIVILAGDVTPIDIISHLPAWFEDKNIPYIYVPSKEDLATAIGRKGSCVTYMVMKDAAYQDLFEDCTEDINAMPLPV